MKSLILEIIGLIVLMFIGMFIVFGTIYVAVDVNIYRLIIILGVICIIILLTSIWKSIEDISDSYKAYRWNRPVKILNRVNERLNR